MDEWMLSMPVHNWNMDMVNEGAYVRDPTTRYSRYACRMCSTKAADGTLTGLYDYEQSKHNIDPIHVANVQVVIDRHKALMKRILQAERLRILMKNFGSPDRVHLLLYKHIFEDTEEALEEARKLSNKYQKIEPLVILELALWKTACILNPPEGIKDFVTFYMCGGWKATKASMRHHSLIGSVMNNVLPFLGNEIDAKP